jgi:hypothetical protein
MGQGIAMTDSHTRGLTSLSTTIKTLAAKMTLLKSDIQNTLSALPESSRPAIFETYDSIGQDLHSLLNDWQSGRVELLRLLPDDDERTTAEIDESIADSGVGTSIPEYDPWNKRVSCGDWGIFMAATRVASPVLSSAEGMMGEVAEDLAGEEETGVFEGTARGQLLGAQSGGGVLSRVERIERARRERDEVLERKRITLERTRWVGELKDVLGRRNR